MAGITSSSRSSRGKRGQLSDDNSPENKSQQEIVTRRGDDNSSANKSQQETVTRQTMHSWKTDPAKLYDHLYEQEAVERQGLPPASEKTYDLNPGFKKGGKVSASKRADGIAQRGKTRGKYL
jgi:hypothetical protein